MIVAVIATRTGSNRLPKKVLLPILGEPMLARQIERVRRSRMIDRLLVATTSDHADDEIEHLAWRMSVPCYRGGVHDVIDRFYRAVEPYRADHAVRLTHDCPLADAGLIDEVIRYHIEQNNDYTNNVDPPTFPDGLDVEVFKMTALRQAWLETVTQKDREHVTWYIRQNPHKFKVGHFTNDTDLSHLRWTVDYADDLERVRRIFEHFGNDDFTWRDVLAFERKIRTV